MANLLCIYENVIATVESLKDFCINLSKYDNRVNVKFISTVAIIEKDIYKSDILMFIRPNNAFFSRIAKIARANGIFVIFFLDDDLANLPAGSVDMPWRKKGLIKTARESDFILSSSPHIQKKYSKMARIDRSISSDTAVYPESIVQHKEHDGIVRIVYAAGISHYVLFNKFVRPILKQIDEKYGKRISLTFMGVHPKIDVDDYEMKINFIDSLPLDKYRETIGIKNFDIGLAPLEQTEFSRCKYFNKFIEYSMFGIVGIYSKVEPYTFVIKDEVNGLLTDNNDESWFRTISKAIEDKELIRKCRESAYKELEERFNSKSIMDGLISSIPELVQNHIERKNRFSLFIFYKLVYFLSRVADWGYKSIYYLKRGGIKDLIKSIKRHFAIAERLR